ncbi:conserved oligomeric Golgi complex subunit 4 [Aphomia sociella]
MSLTLLLEKYDVSTEDGLQRALLEIEKEEAKVDEALSGVLSRACLLEDRLRTTSQAYTKLGEVKSDAQAAADMVDRTAVLARDVSAKVRQLDLARSRVAECQRRVHDLIDLQLCSAGVEAAIKAHDYETGAAHVARYLSMDPGSLEAARARGGPDPRGAMARAAATLGDHLVRKFEEAAKKEDEDAVERLFKLFPQIGRAEEGVDLLAKYLLTQVEGAVRRACVVPSGGATDAAVYADAMTRVLEAGGAAVERARRALCAAPPAAGLLPRAVLALQPAVCAGARRVFSWQRVARLQGARAAAGGALAAEPALAELALSLSRVRLYFDFLRRKTEADAASLDEAGKQKSQEAIEKLIAESELTRTAQDMLAQYLELERYFLEESVNKALKMATPQVGTTTSSLVDDVFFIARKVIRRSVSAGSVDGACAVLNEAGALLERGAAALRRWLRAPPDALPLPAPPAAPPAAPAPAPQLDAQRALFLAHLNEAEAGAEWASRLAAEAVAEAEAGALCRCARDAAKLRSCAAGLAAAAAAFRAAADLALAGLRAALQPRLAAWADALADPEEMEEESDADALPQALDVLADSARAQLSARAADAVLLAAVTDLATRAEAKLLQHHYTREGGLSVERRARRLAAWAGGGAAAARERCARLAQAAALLALERPQHARHALRPAARLAPADARDVLARRYVAGAVRPQHARHALRPAARLAPADARDVLARRYVAGAVRPQHARHALRPAARLAPADARDVLARRYVAGAVRPQHARHALRPAARLAPADARDVLARRYVAGAVRPQHARHALRPAARLAPADARDVLARRYVAGAVRPQHARHALRPAARLAPADARDVLARRYVAGAVRPQHARHALRPAARLAPADARDVLARRYVAGAVRPQHARHALRPAARLAPADARDVLARRYVAGAVRPQHARHALRPAARLAPADARDVLARRYVAGAVRPQHARHALRPAARLAPADARDVLARRYVAGAVRPQHARHALRPAARLAPADARDVLARRYVAGAVRPQHARHALRPAARLAPADARDVLARRYVAGAVRPQHARHALRPAARLAPADARDVLARRYVAGAVRPQHARHALRPAARLAPADARDVLARRTDFKIEDIKRLKL